MNDMFLYRLGQKRGGGGSSDVFKEFFDKTITEVTSDASTVNDYAFQNCASLTKAIFPKANAIKQYAFDGCASLAEIDFKEVTSVGNYCFRNCVNLESARLPKLTGKTMDLFCMSVGNGAGGVNNGTAVRLKVADLGFVTTVNKDTFRHCTALTTVILRSPTVATLEGVSAFWYTPFYHLATGGTVYVPSALIESYKAASNWSALHTSASLNFAPIEGSEYE